MSFELLSNIKEGNMIVSFWNFARKRYQINRPSLIFELALFLWSIFFITVYGSALLKGWIPNAIEFLVGCFFVIVPSSLLAMHVRIRIEYNKGSDAIYRKWVSCRSLK